MLNKNILRVIVAVILCYEEGIACVELTKSPRATESCQVSGCEFTCSEINWDWLLLLSVYNQHTTCHSNGINLTLPSHRDVPGANFTWNWFPSNIYFDMKIMGLQIDLQYTYNIGKLGDHPFTLQVFTNVKYLRLNNLHINVLPKWTFDGLSSLQELVINNATIYSHSNGMLEYFKNSLKSFSLIEQNEGNSMSISSFIGRDSVNLTKMEYVKIQYKLGIIDDTSLTAIPFVEVLDLSECYITSILEHSFDTFESNLQVLNLERNKLITLPTDLFSKLQLTSVLHTRNENLKIRLLENPWHCDLTLVYVKQLLVNYTNFDEDVLCESPENKNGTRIIDAELDGIATTSTSTTLEITITTSEVSSEVTPEITPEVSSEITPEITGTTLETTTTFLNDCDSQLISKGCHGSYDKISIPSKTLEIQLSFQSGEIFVQSDYNRSEMLLIWFGSELVSNDLLMYQKGAMIECVTNFSPAAVNNLTEGLTYTFCLMNVSEPTVSPLNCLSYHHGAIQRENVIWMYKNKKSLFMGLIFTFLIVAITSGCVIGIFSTRRALKPGKNVSIVFESSFVAPQRTSIKDTVIQTSDSFSASQTAIASQLHGEELYVTALEDIIDSPPPLPPYRKWTNIIKEHDESDNNDECENYYSVVK